ncbi:MAG: hypothetical protein F4187_00420 [Gemmatimonadetes bacterium]|nr:hypothetical protein [Gemmatimonadota bacterium]
MAEKNVSIGVLAALGAVVALAGLPAGMAAQEANTRMALQPFLGCWQPDGQEEEEGILCFVADGNQVEMLTVGDGGITHRELFAVDGQLRSIVQDGCTGEESARFSDDYRRIYTTSSVTCSGEPPRSGTGIIFMPEADQWVDVRAIAADDSEVTAWAQWYVRTGESELNDLGIESGRYAAPLAVRAMAGGPRAPITIDDVIDATGNVHEKAVEAWIAEVGQEFAGLDVDDLLELDGAGVSGNLIDVIVAVSFPERFALSQPQQNQVQPGYYGARPIWIDPYYSRWGYPYGSYYSGWGYRYGPYRSSYYYPRVIVDVTPVRPSGGGRVIAGRGYSSGGSSRGFIGSSSSGSSRISTGGGSSGRSSTGRTAKGRGSSSSLSSWDSGGSSSTGSAASRASSGGTRGGVSTTSTGRTAQRRGGSSG